MADRIVHQCLKLGTRIGAHVAVVTRYDAGCEPQHDSSKSSVRDDQIRSAADHRKLSATCAHNVQSHHKARLKRRLNIQISRAADSESSVETQPNVLGNR